MSSRDTIKILVAIIGAAGVIIAALITGIFALLVEQTKTNASATNVAATYVAQRTIDAPLPRAVYTLPATYTPLPTQQPYTTIPTPKPNVTVVLPSPPFVVTATPNADQQNPPPGSTILGGQGFTKKGITILAQKSLKLANNQIGPSFEVTNNNSDDVYILWNPSVLHLKDDRGKNYPFIPCSNNDSTGQFVIRGGGMQQIGGWWSGACFNIGFQGLIDTNAKYLILSIDKFAGMENMNWRYDLP